MQQIDDLVAARAGQHPHHAEVDHADAVVGQEQDIAGVRIGMEIAVFQHHAQHRVGTACRQQLGIEPAGTQPVRGNARHADDFLLHVDAVIGEFPIHLGDLHQRVVGKVARELVDIARLLGEIEFAFQRATELRDDLHRVVAPGIRHFAFQQFGRVFQNAQIGPDHPLDAGTAHLDDNRRAVLERGAVHLRDRGGRQRHRIELGKHVVGITLEGLHQAGVQHFVRHCRHLAVQFLEFGNPVRRKHVHPRRQQLAQFDEGRAEFFQCATDTHRCLELADFAGALPVQHPPRALQHAADAQDAHQIAPAVANHHRGDFMQSRQVANDRNGFPEHRCFLESEMPRV